MCNSINESARYPGKQNVQVAGYPSNDACLQVLVILELIHGKYVAVLLEYLHKNIQSLFDNRAYTELRTYVLKV